MIKRIFSVLIVLAMLPGLSGCENSAVKKVQITMYLWDKPMEKELTPWLEQKFPDIDFTFVAGYNSMDFYMDLNARGSLPDIITCRRFSLNDAAQMSDLLMDLSGSDIVGSYYDSYISNNREPSGAVRWLPLCAEVDGYIANADLFEANNIPLPTNQAEFAEACKRFEELGIRGYTNDYRMDYSCMEALQGSAIPELMSMDGTMWRMEYENEANDNQRGLDDKVYSVSMFGDLNFIEGKAYCGCPMLEELKNKLELQDTNVYTLFRTALADGQQFAEPSEYVSFVKKA